MASLEPYSFDLPQDKATWERQIANMREILKDARKAGNTKLVKMYEERIDRALDNYTRDVRS